MEHNYVVGPPRTYRLDANLTGDLPAGPVYHKTEINVKNDGNKRTAILGFHWFAQNLLSILDDNGEVQFMVFAIEDLPNGKQTVIDCGRAILHIPGLLSNYSNFEGSSGQIELEHPVLLKNGKIRLQIGDRLLGDDRQLDCFLVVKVANAIIKDDMGDSIDSVKLNPGRRTSQRRGDRHVSAFNGERLYP